MLIDPILTETDTTKLSTVGRDVVVLSHRLDMTGAFEDAAIKAYISSHPLPELELLPSNTPQNRALVGGHVGEHVFSDVVMQNVGVKLKRVTERHTVLEEIAEQLRIELEENTQACINPTLDMLLLPKSMEIECSTNVEYVLNVYGEVDVILDNGRHVMLGEDRLLSTFPNQISHLVGRDNFSLVLTSSVSD